MPAPVSAAEPKRIVLIAGTKSHPPGFHEYEKGVRILKASLETSPNAASLVRVDAYFDGWPDDDKNLDGADAILMYCDGSDHDENAHPILRGDRLNKIGELMKKGVGFAAIHYTVFVPGKRGGAEFLDWIGGYFDYETGAAPNHWLSKIRTEKTKPYPASPTHPISRGLPPSFELNEEYYFNIRFDEKDPRLTPILKTPMPGETDDQTVAWCVERADGGRGFGFTGGHFHSNWADENFRRMVLNALLWIAHAEVPKEGALSPPPTPEQLAPSQNPQTKND